MTVTNVPLDPTEVLDIATALGQWANYIETGHVTLSAADLIARRDPKRWPNVLDEHQQHKVLRLRALANRVLKTHSDAGTS